METKILRISFICPILINLYFIIFLSYFADQPTVHEIYVILCVLLGESLLSLGVSLANQRAENGFMIGGGLLNYFLSRALLFFVFGISTFYVLLTQPHLKYQDAYSMYFVVFAIYCVFYVFSMIYPWVLYFRYRRNSEESRSKDNGFYCPCCDRFLIRILKSVEASSEYGDESRQLLKCRGCGQYSLGACIDLYESRSLDHWAVPIFESDAKIVRTVLDEYEYLDKRQSWEGHFGQFVDQYGIRTGPYFNLYLPYSSRVIAGQMDWVSSWKSEYERFVSQKASQ